MQIGADEEESFAWFGHGILSGALASLVILLGVKQGGCDGRRTGQKICV